VSLATKSVSRTRPAEWSILMRSWRSAAAPTRSRLGFPPPPAFQVRVSGVLSKHDDQTIQKRELTRPLKMSTAHARRPPSSRPRSHDNGVRGNAIQAHLMHWTDARVAWALTGVGLRTNSLECRTPGRSYPSVSATCLARRAQHGNRLASILGIIRAVCFAARGRCLKPLRRPLLQIRLWLFQSSVRRLQ